MFDRNDIITVRGYNINGETVFHDDVPAGDVERVVKELRGREYFYKIVIEIKIP